MRRLRASDHRFSTSGGHFDIPDVLDDPDVQDDVAASSTQSCDSVVHFQEFPDRVAGARWALPRTIGEPVDDDRGGPLLQHPQRFSGYCVPSDFVETFPRSSLQHQLGIEK